jgi:hypothetical protein
MRLAKNERSEVRSASRIIPEAKRSGIATLAENEFQRIGTKYEVQVELSQAQSAAG